jgi:iron(III) transport system substrate-binding protein
MHMRGFRYLAVMLALSVVATAPTDASARELMIYNASDNVNTPLVAAFRQKHPDVTVRFVSGSTGPITERAIAERARPQADVVYLVNNLALEQLKTAGVFAPYRPRGVEIPEQFRDADDFYVLHFATTMCMLVNTQRLAERNLPMPVSWEDLIRPVYKGEISLPSPLRSGTGVGILTTFVDAFGWNFVENLHQNVRQYSDGGSGGAQLAATGELAIGLSFDTTCHSLKSAGRPVEIVHGRITPNVMEGGGLVAGARNEAEAKLFLDFMASEEAAKVLSRLVGATAFRGHGLVDLATVTLWQMRRPVDVAAFRRSFAERFQR